MPWTKKSPEFILEGLNVNNFLLKGKVVDLCKQFLHKKGFPRALKFTILYTVKTKEL